MRLAESRSMVMSLVRVNASRRSVTLEPLMPGMVGGNITACINTLNNGHIIERVFYSLKDILLVNT